MILVTPWLRKLPCYFRSTDDALVCTSSGHLMTRFTRTLFLINRDTLLNHESVAHLLPPSGLEPDTHYLMKRQ